MKKNTIDFPGCAGSIIDTIREPLIILDGDFKVVSASRSFYEVFKVIPEETVGNLIYDLGNKQWDIPRLRELLETILPEKTTFENYEVEHDFTSIGRRIMLLNARQVERAAGKERLILLAIEDVTERRRVQLELEESEERYRRAFETSRDSLLLVHKTEGVILNSNAAAQELLGYSGKGLSKKKLWEIGMVKDAGDFQETSSRLEKSGMVRYEDTPVKTSKGKIVNADVFLVDRAKVAQCNIRDITGRKQAEDEKRTLAEELVRAERLAAMGELISGVAHEINNPLTGMIGLSELLVRNRKANLDEGTQKDIEFIYKAGLRIQKIVGNLLRFARRKEPTRKNVSIHEIIDTILTLRDYEMKSRNIRVEKNYRPEVPKIMADPSQLEQVFLNLIINAEYAMLATGGGGTLTVNLSLKGAQPEQQEVVVEIADTGRGIPADVLPKLFNPFFTTKPVGKGTGLGLSVGYGIIKEHGGEIIAGNREEGGSVFTITLPVRRGK